jgi:hypothetical protein
MLTTSTSSFTSKGEIARRTMHRAVNGKPSVSSR